MNSNLGRTVIRIRKLWTKLFLFTDTASPRTVFAGWMILYLTTVFLWQQVGVPLTAFFSIAQTIALYTRPKKWLEIPRSSSGWDVFMILFGTGYAITAFVSLFITLNVPYLIHAISAVSVLLITSQQEILSTPNSKKRVRRLVPAFNNN